eukprot:gnl/Chilomastix_caulleri/1104.p2 GENE.gnl/Chilomastix_caulleri/1104~~gnl/Chilomastix_caulleri/1104.p2  ORF type:complete len:149 (+),score=41.52 gnl/Chilomastix_caulleri/1104:366-812(+)
MRILTEGKAQQTARERKAKADGLRLQIAGLVAARTLNTGVDPPQPYAPAMIAEAMREVGFQPREGSVSQQATTLIELLIAQGYPIKAAALDVVVACKTKHTQSILDELPEGVEFVSREDAGDTSTLRLALSTEAYGQLRRVAEAHGGG